MARYNQDWDDLGRAVQEIVDRAVSSHDYEKLSRTIRQAVDKAVDVSTDAVHRAKTTTSYQQPRRVLVEQKKNLPALYGSTSGKVVTGVLKTVFGGIATFFSLISLISLTVLNVLMDGVGLISAVIPLLLMGGGGFLLGSGIRTLTRMNRFKTYRATLGQKTHCALEKLARSVGKSVKFVRKELLGMIDEGLFLEGHLDKEQQSLITSHETYQYFEQSRLQLEQRRQAEEQRRAQMPVHDPRVQEVLDKGDAFLLQIRSCNDDIPGLEISEKISRIENILERIFDRAEQDPSVIPDLKKMMDYYLPMTVKLLRAYADMDSQPVQGENIQNSKREIEATLDTLSLAFEKLLDELFEDTALDIASDISVLNTLLAQEGLKEDELSRMKKEISE